MNESVLLEKLIKIEALYTGAATEGEKISAERARERILEKLRELLLKDPPVEYKFTFSDMYSRKVFTALLRRYDLKPYRYHRQRYTTVMAQVPKTFVDETLWPEFLKISAELDSYLKEITERVVKKVLHEDDSEAVVVDQPLQIDFNSNTVVADLEQSAPTETEKKPERKKKKKSEKRKKKKKGKKKKRGR